MPIQALPPATTRLIGSTQVLTDPSSVVKELIDNALDARATSIFVEVAANTIDVIQVRDNGHGIAPDDRSMVCKRYCTSKIREFADLRTVGGNVLGFRGEALASLAEMSGSVTLTTRVEGEACAVNLKIGRNGEVEGQERASHPVGTTVRATDFFKGLPVRKQAALKHSAKYLAKIKRTMQAYALCRPTVRLSLRVLKAKNEKGNWMYAPKQGAGVEDAAFKVGGKDCAAQCAWSVLESHGFTMQAFLPTPDADSAKISGVGQFLSVDSRPVSAARGTLKQIVSMFKEKLRKANPNLENARDPFLYLNVVCPPDSYDPNVEPTKDDVLFDNSTNVLAAVEELLATCYPEAPSKAAESGSGFLDEQASSRTEKQPLIEVFEDVSSATDAPDRGRRAWRSNMYGHDEEDLVIADEPPQSKHEQEDDTEQDVRGVNVSNPWVIAKMTASAHKKRSTSLSNGQLMTPLRERSGAEVNSSSPARTARQAPSAVQAPITPQASSQIRSSQDEMLRQSIHRLVSSPPHRLQPDDDEISLLSARRPSDQPRNDFVSARDLPLGTPLHAIPEAASRPRRSARREQRQDANEPVESPRDDPRDNWFKIGAPSQRQRQAGPPRRRAPAAGAQPFWTPRSQTHGTAGAFVSPIAPSDARNNRDIREFVTAGELVSAGPGWSDELTTAVSADDTDMLLQPSAAQAGKSGSAPVQPLASRRRRRASASPEVTVDEADVEFQRHLEGSLARPCRRPGLVEGLTDANSTEATSTPQVAEEQHTDALQRKRQRTTDGGLQRSKSALLPLERVPAKFRTQNIIHRLSTSTGSVTENLQKLDTVTNRVGWSFPPDSAYNAFATPPTPSELQAWTVRLTHLLEGVHPNQETDGSLREVLAAAISHHMNDYLVAGTA